MRNYLLSMLLLLFIVACKEKKPTQVLEEQPTNTEQDYQNALEFQNKYRPDYKEIVKLIVADTANIFLIPGEQNVIKRPKTINVLDSTRGWSGGRFRITKKHIQDYENHVGREAANPYYRSYIFKDHARLDSVFSLNEKARLAFVSKRLEKEKIVIDDKFSQAKIVSGDLFDSLTIRLIKPILSEDKKYLFVGFDVYFSWTGEKINVSGYEQLYGDNIIVFVKNEANEWEVCHRKIWLRL